MKYNKLLRGIRRAVIDEDIFNKGLSFLLESFWTAKL